MRKIRIVCNRKYIKHGLQENEDKLKKELNENVINNLTNQAKKEFDRNRKELKQKETEFIYPNYYVEIQKLLLNKLLNIDEEEIETIIKSIELTAELDGLF